MEFGLGLGMELELELPLAHELGLHDSAHISAVALFDLELSEI